MVLNSDSSEESEDNEVRDVDLLDSTDPYLRLRFLFKVNNMAQRFVDKNNS